MMMAATLLFAAAPVFAQHGHGGGMGMGGGMGHGMGHTMSSEEGSHAQEHQSSHQLAAQNPGDVLSRNSKLASKLQALLPKGTNLQSAASGFKNLGQFVAAVHVAHNLGIPFSKLKAKMIGPPAESLGEAIQQLRPTANAKKESHKATKQADSDLKES
jgi:hypothetical protein